MAGFYDEMQSLAVGLLTEFNQGVVRHVAVTGGSGAADEPGASTETATTLDGAVVRGVEFRFAQLSHVVESDLQVVMAGGGLVPDMADYFLIDGMRYKVVEIARTPAAGTVVKYDVIVRK